MMRSDFMNRSGVGAEGPVTVVGGCKLNAVGGWGKHPNVICFTRRRTLPAVHEYHHIR